MVFYGSGLDADRVCQLKIDVVTCVFDGDNAIALFSGNNGDRFPAVAAQGKKKGFHFIIVGIDRGDWVFRSYGCVIQCHCKVTRFQLDSATKS